MRVPKTGEQVDSSTGLVQIVGKLEGSQMFVTWKALDKGWILKRKHQFENCKEVFDYDSSMCIRKNVYITRIVLGLL